MVHEWGTFTSLQGSDGRVMDGLHHTEELLPAFVHGRLASGDGLHKSMEELPEVVTQSFDTRRSTSMVTCRAPLWTSSSRVA